MKREGLSAGRLAPLLGAALFAITIPLLVIFPLGIAGNPYDEKRMVQVLLLALLPLLLLSPALRSAWYARLAAIPAWFNRTLLFIFLAGFLSASRAQLPQAALLELALWGTMFNAMVIVAAVRQQLGVTFERMMVAMLGGLLFIYLTVDFALLLQAMLAQHDLNARLIFFNFFNGRFFNQFQSWTLPLVLLPVFYARRQGWQLVRWLMGAAAANWWLLLFLAGGRGTLFSVATATLLTMLLWRGAMGYWLRWQLGTAGAGLLAYLLLDWLAATPLQPVTLMRGSLSGRSELWQQAWSMMVDHPLLGVGPMHFACAAGAGNAHPHNALLQIGAEWGGPVVAAVIVLAGWLLLRALAQSRNGETGEVFELKPLLLASLVSAAVHAQLSGIIVMPLSQLMLVLIGGWCWGAFATVPALATPSLRSLTWGAVMLASLVVVIAAVAPAWHRAWQGDIAPLELKRELHPRFWLDGALCADQAGDATGPSPR